MLCDKKPKIYEIDLPETNAFKSILSIFSRRFIKSDILTKAFATIKKFKLLN